MNRIKKVLSNLRLALTKFGSKWQFHKYPFFLIYNLRGYKFKKTFDIMNIIKPGDIILRTYDNYLSYFFIPGEWKHAALVVDKKHVIHSITAGVVKEDIIQFCRTDHICVIRLKEGTFIDNKHFIKRAIKLAHAELGKQYDYEFDSTNQRKFYCSELVDFCYQGLLKLTPKPCKILKIFNTMPIISPSDLAESTEIEIIYNSKE